MTLVFALLHAALHGTWQRLRPQSVLNLVLSALVLHCSVTNLEVTQRHQGARQNLKRQNNSTDVCLSALFSAFCITAALCSVTPVGWGSGVWGWGCWVGGNFVRRIHFFFLTVPGLYSTLQLMPYSDTIQKISMIKYNTVAINTRGYNTLASAATRTGHA